MADKIFHTGFNQKTNPAGADKVMISDSQAGNETKYTDLDNLPISTATQTALNNKVDKVAGKGLSTNDYDNTEKAKVDSAVQNVIAGQNTTVSRNGNTITVNSLGGPAVVTDGFNRNYFIATEGQTEFTATFDFTENTGSVIVTLNGNVLKPTLDYTEPGLNKVVFVSGLTAGDEVQLITGIKGPTGNGISTIIRTSGTGAPGTTDTYTITFTDTTTTTFTVYNGADGVGTVSSVNSGAHITVDNTDPNNPVINYDGELFSTTLKNKLAGIDDGAEVNTINAGDNVSSLVNDAGYATGGGTASGTNTGDQTITTGTVVATGGQTVVTVGTYVLGNNKLRVEVNGLGQVIITDYTETSTTSITFTSGLTAGDVVKYTILS